MKFAVRYLLIVLIFVICALANIDRSNISVAGSFLAVDYQISRIQLGWVFSAFMVGYAAFLIPAGWIAGKVGPRRTLTGGLIWWGALTAATALVPATMANSLWALLAVRFLLGLGEALVYPSANQFIAAWFPSDEHAKANGWVHSGAQAGSGMAPPLMAFFIYDFGWQAAFYVSAAIGLVIAVFWYAVARDLPAQHPSVRPDELKHIRAGLPIEMDGTMPLVPWLKIFSDRNIWGTALAHLGFGYCATIFSTWFFIYLRDGRGFDLKASAILCTLPFVSAAFCCLLGGVVSDWLVRRRTPYVGRSLFGAFTLLSSGIILIGGGHAQNGIVAALLLSGAVGVLYLGQASYYAVAADLGGPFTGVISGVVSMCSQLGGAATALLTPFFASKFGWDYAFTAAACVNFVCIIPWLFVKPEQRLYGEGR